MLSLPLIAGVRPNEPNFFQQDVQGLKANGNRLLKSGSLSRAGGILSV